MKLPIWIGLAMLLFFSACKKDEASIDTCSNGYLDPGEAGIDCGGTCGGNCGQSQPSYVYLECNGIPITMATKTMTLTNGFWSLLAYNDTLTVQFNLGNNGSVAVFPIQANGSYGELNGNLYLQVQNGTGAFYSHDTLTNKMSGFFQVDFIRDGTLDTLKIRNGQFENMFY